MTAHSTDTPTDTPAELADRTTLAVALAMFIVALMFAADVAGHFAAGGFADVLDVTGKGLAVLAVVVVIGTYFRKFRRMSASERSAYLAEDGFLQSSFRRALSKSWMAVFVLLALLQALDQLVLDRLPGMPIEVVLQSVLTLMLIAFSIAFVRVIGSDGDSDQDPGDEPAHGR